MFKQIFHQSHTFSFFKTRAERATTGAGDKVYGVRCYGCFLDINHTIYIEIVIKIIG
jgi:hypothetical protein